MKLLINGKMEEISPFGPQTAMTVALLLSAKQVEPRMVAVEVNAKMIDRKEYETTPLSEGDRVELLFFMGGGR